MDSRGTPLTIIGDVGVDIVLGPLREWPTMGTETLLDRSELRAGGSAGNTALAVHYLGGDSRLLSLVGNDDFGAWLARQFQDTQASLPTCDAPTSMSIGLLHDSERTFFTTRGHLDRISLRDVQPRLGRAADPHAMLMLCGVFLTPKLRKSYDMLIDDAHRLGYQVAIDTGWPSEGWKADTRTEAGRWIARCDHVLLNELEVLSLAGADDLATAVASVTNLMKSGASLIVKSGERGALGFQHGARASSPAKQIRAFDTIGAGDSFNAGYLLARMRGDDLASALAAGCHAATAIIARFPRRDIRRGEISLPGATAPALERALS